MLFSLLCCIHAYTNTHTHLHTPHLHTHFSGSCSRGQVGMFRAAVCFCTCMSHMMKTSAESSAPEVCSVLSKCNNTAVSRPLCLLLLHIYALILMKMAALNCIFLLLFLCYSLLCIKDIKFVLYIHGYTINYVYVAYTLCFWSRPHTHLISPNSQHSSNWH